MKLEKEVEVDLNKLIIDFCKEPKSVQEIMDEFGLDSRTVLEESI